MRSSKAPKLFEEWLKKNNKKFNHPLCRIGGKRGSATYRYKGIVDAITVHVVEDGVSVSADYNGVNFDRLRDIDVMIEKDENGYYCGYCMPEHITHYTSTRELIIDHIFLELLEWSNEHIKPKNYLMLCRYGQGSTWAKIVPPDTVRHDRELDCVVCLMLLEEITIDTL